VGVKHFKDLRCWQLANELKKEVYALIDHPPADRDRHFCDDIRASARSAPSNIAEGFGRYTHREFAHFLSVAHASLVETENHLQDACDSRYISTTEQQRLTDLSQAAQRAVSRLRTYLQTTRQRPTAKNDSSVYGKPE